MMGIGGAGARGGKLGDLAELIGGNAKNGDELVFRAGFGWRPKSTDRIGPDYFLNPQTRGVAFDVIRSVRAQSLGSVSAVTDVHSGLAFSAPGASPELVDHSFAEKVLRFSGGAYLEADMATAAPTASTQPDGPLQSLTIPVPADMEARGVQFRLPSLIDGPGEVLSLDGTRLAGLSSGVRLSGLFIDGTDYSASIGQGPQFAGYYDIFANSEMVRVMNMGFSEATLRIDYYDAENDANLAPFRFEYNTSVIAVGCVSSPSGGTSGKAFRPIVSFGTQSLYWAIGVDDATNRWAIQNQNETVVLSDAPFPNSSILLMKPGASSSHEVFVYERFGSPARGVLRMPAYIKRVDGQYLQAPDSGSVMIGRSHANDGADDHSMRLSSLIFTQFDDAELLTPNEMDAIARYVNAQEASDV